MKNYIYKISILIVFLYFLYEFTIGKEIRHVQKFYHSYLTSANAKQFKTNIKDKITELNNQEKIFYDDDARILSIFIKKILKELNLN